MRALSSIAVFHVAFRIALQENLELIRIQRELQEKKNSLSMLETQRNQKCTRLQATEAANRELVSTVNRLQQDLQAKDMELASLKAALVSSNSYKLKVTTVGLLFEIIWLKLQKFPSASARILSIIFRQDCTFIWQRDASLNLFVFSNK
ncbi:unnamed protein product [Dibothriocephalus latus]|uniref:Uncharacterized protein n=1 Tax=Dibothriocephalus latus TaxID=60516 RepID=A0A3P7LLF7_DIBLA|nr:unnamed protein product [Dibothriocephalus latus]